jgi:hypothetical protein
MLLCWKAENDAIYIDSVWMAVWMARGSKKETRGRALHLCDREGSGRVANFLNKRGGGVTWLRGPGQAM